MLHAFRGRASRFALLLVAFCLAVPILSVGTAGAVVTSGCDAGNYPVVRVGQSALTVRCVFAADDSSRKFTIHDFENARWHGGAARKVTDATYNRSTGVITSATAHFLASDVNHGVSSTTLCGTTKVIAVRSIIKSVSSLTSAVITPPPAGTSSAHVVSAKVTSGTKNLSTPTLGGFDVCDVGRKVTGGSGLPANVTVASVTSTTNQCGSTTLKGGCAQLSANATATTAFQNRTVAAAVAPKAPATLTIENSSSRSVGDAAVMDGSTTVQSPTMNFVAGDVGRTITGSGIPDGATI